MKTFMSCRFAAARCSLKFRIRQHLQAVICATMWSSGRQQARRPGSSLAGLRHGLRRSPHVVQTTPILSPNSPFVSTTRRDMHRLNGLRSRIVSARLMLIEPCPGSSSSPQTPSPLLHPPGRSHNGRRPGAPRSTALEPGYKQPIRRLWPASKISSVAQEARH